MTTMAIIGAGPGLGAAAARHFGSQGFDLALIARNGERLRQLTDELAANGMTARGYRADVTDLDTLTSALSSAAEELGPIEVLQYSPVPQPEFLRPILDTLDPDVLAATLWRMHTDRDTFRVFAEPMNLG